jgi:hypothetical protein
MLLGGIEMKKHDHPRHLTRSQKKARAQALERSLKSGYKKEDYDGATRED